MTTPAIFEKIVEVQTADIDQLGHVNNIAYLRWVQEIAAAHWAALAPIEDQQNLLWVVLRHEIDYKQPAFLGQTLIVRTWVGASKGLKFERHTEIIRGSHFPTLAKALTIWCPLNSSTKKPAQVSPQLRALFSRT